MAQDKDKPAGDEPLVGDFMRTDVVSVASDATI